MHDLDLQISISSGVVCITLVLSCSGDAAASYHNTSQVCLYLQLSLWGVAWPPYLSIYSSIYSSIWLCPTSQAWPALPWCWVALATRQPLIIIHHTSLYIFTSASGAWRSHHIYLSIALYMRRPQFHCKITQRLTWRDVNQWPLQLKATKRLKKLGQSKSSKKRLFACNEMVSVCSRREFTYQKGKLGPAHSSICLCLSSQAQPALPWCWVALATRQPPVIIHHNYVYIFSSASGTWRGHHIYRSIALYIALYGSAPLHRPDLLLATISIYLQHSLQLYMALPHFTSLACLWPPYLSIYSTIYSSISRPQFHYNKTQRLTWREERTKAVIIEGG